MRKLVCVVGDKGGIGKSTWAKGFADHCRTQGVRAALFDGDWFARSLFKVFCTRGADGSVVPLPRQDPRTGCVLYNIRHRSLGRDLLLNSLAVPDVDLVLHDLPAGFRGDFSQVMGIDDPERAVSEFVLAIRDLGVQTVFVTVVAPHLGGHQSALWLAETVGGTARVVAVRNGQYGDDSFGLWRAGDQRRFVEAGGIESFMPGMEPTTYLNLDALSVRWSQAMAADSLSVADKVRATAWCRAFEAEMAKLRDAMGVATPPTAGERVTAHGG